MADSEAVTWSALGQVAGTLLSCAENVHLRCDNLANLQYMGSTNNFNIVKGSIGSSYFKDCDSEHAILDWINDAKHGQESCLEMIRAWRCK